MKKFKFKVRIGTFGGDDAADITVDGRVVGWLERVHGERFASTMSPARVSFLARYSLMLTDDAADAQLHRRCVKHTPQNSEGQQMSAITSMSTRAKTGFSQNTAVISHREWISLGVLALEAAERAHGDNDEHAESYYLTLARKCDEFADQWTAMKGTRA